jgi:hypothetical protein
MTNAALFITAIIHSMSAASVFVSGETTTANEAALILVAE